MRQPKPKKLNILHMGGVVLASALLGVTVAIQKTGIHHTDKLIEGALVSCLPALAAFFVPSHRDGA